MPRNKKLENVINMFGDKGLPGPLQEQVDQYRKEQQEEREAAERRAQQEQEQREAAELEAWRARSKKLRDQLDRNAPREGERPSDALRRRWAEAEQAGKEAAVRHIQEREADKGVLRKGFEQFSRGVGNTLSSMGEGAIQIKEGAQNALGMETPYTSETQIYRQTPEQQMAQEIQRQSLAETTGDFASKIPGAIGSSIPYMVNPSVGVSAGITSGTAAGAANVEEALKSGKMGTDEYGRAFSQVAGQEVLGAAESLLGPGGVAKGGFIKSALGEGLEEGLQTAGEQALNYATDMAGERDKTMGQRAGEVAEAAALGTAVGGVVSGTTVAADTVANYVSGPSRKSATAISKMSEEDVQSLPPATQEAVKELQKSKPRSKAEREKAQTKLSEAIQKDAQAETQTPSESPVKAPVTPSEATQVESVVQPVEEAPAAPKGAPEERGPFVDEGLLNDYESRKSATADNAATLEAGGVTRTFDEVKRSRKNVKEVPTIDALNKKFEKFEESVGESIFSIKFWDDMQLLAQSQQSQGKGDKLPSLVRELRKGYDIDTKKMFPDKAARNAFETWAKLRKAEMTGEPVTDVSETAHQTSTGVYVTVPSIKDVAKGSKTLRKALSKKGGLQGMQGQLKDLLGFLRESAGATGKYDPEAGAAVDLPQMIKEAVSPRLETILKDHGMAEFSEQVSRETGGKAKGKPYTEVGTGQFVIKPQNAGFAGRAYADTLLDMADRVWGDGRETTTGDVFGTATLETRKLLKDTMVTIASDIYSQLGIAMPAFSEGSVPKGSGIIQRDYAAPRQGQSGMDIASMGPVDAAIAKENIDTAKADKFVSNLLQEGMEVEDAVAIHDALVGLPQKQEVASSPEPVKTPINDPAVGDQPKEFTSKAGGADARLDSMADRDAAIREALSSFDDAQQASLKRVLEQQLDAAVENFANSLDNPENLAKAQQELNDVSNKIERLTGIREKLNKRADRRAGKTTGKQAERVQEVTKKSRPDDFEQAAKAAQEQQEGEIEEVDETPEGVQEVDETGESDLKEEISDLKDQLSGMTISEQKKALKGDLAKVYGKEAVDAVKAEIRAKTKKSPQPKKAKETKKVKKTKKAEKAEVDERTEMESREDAFLEMLDVDSESTQWMESGPKQAPRKKNDSMGAARTPSIQFDAEAGLFSNKHYQNLSEMSNDIAEAIEQNGRDVVGRDLAGSAEVAQGYLRDSGLSNKKLLLLTHDPQAVLKELGISDGGNAFTQLWFQGAALMELDARKAPSSVVKIAASEVAAAESKVAAAMRMPQFFGQSRGAALNRYNSIMQKEIGEQNISKLQTEYMADLNSSPARLASLKKVLAAGDLRTKEDQKKAFDLITKGFGSPEFALKLTNDALFADQVIQDFTEFVRKRDQDLAAKVMENASDLFTGLSYSSMLSGTGTLAVAGIAGAPVQGVVKEAQTAANNLATLIHNRLTGSKIPYKKSTAAAVAKKIFDGKTWKKVLAMKMAGMNVSDIDKRTSRDFTKLGHGQRGRVFRNNFEKAMAGARWGSFLIDYFDGVWEYALISQRMEEKYGGMDAESINKAHDAGDLGKYVSEARELTLKTIEQSYSNEKLGDLLSKITPSKPRRSGSVATQRRDMALYTLLNAAKTRLLPFASIAGRSVITGVHLSAPITKHLDTVYSKEWKDTVEKKGLAAIAALEAQPNLTGPERTALEADAAKYRFDESKLLYSLAATAVNFGVLGALMQSVLDYEEEEDFMTAFKKDVHLSGKRGGSIKLGDSRFQTTRIAPQMNALLNVWRESGEFWEKEDKDVQDFVKALNGMVSATYNDISSMPMLEQYPRILKKFEKASAGEVLASEFEEAVGQIAFPAIIREIQSDRKGVYLSRKGDVLYDPVWGSRPSTAFSFGLKTWKEHAEKYESLSPKQKKLYDASVKAGGENVIHDWAKDTWDMERAGVSEKDRAAYVLKMKEWFDKEMWKDPHYFTKNTLPKYKKAAKKYASKALSKEAKSKLEEFEDLEDKEKAAKRTDKRSAL